MLLKLVRHAASLLALPVLAAGAAVAVPTTPADAALSPASQVLVLTNQQRARYKCPALRTNLSLSRAALAHSRDMAARNYFSHTGRGGTTFVTRARAAGYNYALAENLAWGYRTPAEVVTNWMRSPGHRANILNCSARSAGVGMAVNAKGVPYWTQIFGRV